MKKGELVILATLLTFAAVGSVLAVAIWSITQNITQTVEKASVYSYIPVISLPTGYQQVNGSCTVPKALNVTTKVANLKLWVNQTESQRASIALMYSVFTLELRYAGTDVTFLAIDLRTETSAYAILSVAGNYTFDYYFEYRPAGEGYVSYMITVGVTV